MLLDRVHLLLTMRTCPPVLSRLFAMALAMTLGFSSPAAAMRQLAPAEQSTGLEELTRAVATTPAAEQRLQQVRGAIHDLRNRTNSVVIPLSGLASKLRADSPAARQFGTSVQRINGALGRFRRPYEQAVAAQRVDEAVTLGVGLLREFGGIFGELNAFLGGHSDEEIFAGRVSGASEEWLGEGLKSLRTSVGRAEAFAQEQQAALKAAEAPREEVVDLAQMLPAQQAWLVAEARMHGSITDVQVEVRGEALRVRLVPNHLLSALHNLIVDASQALQRAQRGPGVVHILAFREVRDGRAHIVLRVQDNGPGLPPAVVEAMNKPEVVDRFPSESKGAEHGLGLAGVKREVIERWRGQIEAGNLSDGGARFTITLPLADAEGAARAASGLEEPVTLVPITRDYALQRAEELAAVDQGSKTWEIEGVWGPERFPMDRRVWTGTPLNRVWELSVAAVDAQGTPVGYLYATDGHGDYPVAQRFPGLFLYRLSIRPDFQGQGLGPAHYGQALITTIGQLRIVFPDGRGVNHHIRAVNIRAAMAI